MVSKTQAHYRKHHQENQDNTPKEFYFGSVDWMDIVGTQKPNEDYKNISFSRISNAGHQLIFDNPDEVSWNIIQNAMKDEERQRRMANLAI